MAFNYIQFTSSTADLYAGQTGVISAAVYDSTTSAIDDTFSGVIVFSADTSSTATITIGTASATAVAGIASSAFTATSHGTLNIRAAYDTSVTDGTQTLLVNQYHIVITSSTAPLAVGNNLTLVAEVRNVSLAVDTTSTASVTFSTSGTGALSGTGSATAVNGIASRAVSGLTVGAFTLSASATSAITGTAAMEISNSTRVNSSGAQGKWFSQSPFRITLWDMTGTGRGRGSVKAVISDAKYIGVSSYLNQGGEMFFTLPYNHPQIAECVPLARHYRVDRWDEEDGIYRTVGTGILQDYSATDNETVFYGADYLTVMNQTLTDTASATSGSTVTYNNVTFSSIFQSEMSSVKNQANSRLGFISVEPTINASTSTYKIFTAGEQRTNFLANVAGIAQAGTTSKVVFGNRIETSSQSYNSFFLDMNYATTANNSLRLVYGQNVKRFSYSPNFRSLRTRAVVIATSIFNGITPTKIWSSFATSSLQSTYGVIDRLDLQQDIISSANVSARAAYNLYQSSPDKIKNINIALVDGAVIPFKSYKLGDDIRVIISRGAVSIDSNLTLRGQEWVGREDGSEQISFDFFSRDLQSYEVSPYIQGSALQQINISNNITAGLGDQGSESTTDRNAPVENITPKDPTQMPRRVRPKE